MRVKSRVRQGTFVEDSISKEKWSDKIVYIKKQKKDRFIFCVLLRLEKNKNEKKFWKSRFDSMTHFEWKIGGLEKDTTDMMQILSLWKDENKIWRWTGME